MEGLGQFLKDHLQKSQLEPAEVWERAGFTADTLYRQLREPGIVLRKSNLRALFQVLGMTPNDMHAAAHAAKLAGLPKDAATLNEFARVAAAAFEGAKPDPAEARIMQFPDVTQYNYEQCDALMGALERRMAQLQPAQNARPPRSARTAG